MSVLNIESWQCYNNMADMIARYPGTTGSGWIFAGGSRWGTRYLSIGNVTQIWSFGGARSTIYFGTAIKLTANPVTQADFFKFVDGTTVQMQVGITSTGQLTLNRNGTVLCTTTIPSWPISTWHYLEIKVVFDGTNGSGEIKFDSVLRASFTNQDTTMTANNSATEMRAAGGVSNTIEFCDTWMSDSGYLGDAYIRHSVPSAAGDSTQFTPSTGNNWDCVNDALQDGDTNYVASSTVGHLDLYNFPDVTFNGPIKGVIVTLWMRKDDAGSRQARVVCKSGGNLYYGTTFALGNTYQPFWILFENDPDTGAAWTQGGYNAAQFGVEVVA